MRKVEHELNLLTGRVAELERKYTYVLELMVGIRDALLDQRDGGDNDECGQDAGLDAGRL